MCQTLHHILSVVRRCGKKVYPVEKVDIGVLYHKGCFKCRVCDGQLSLKTFQRQLDPQTRKKVRKLLQSSASLFNIQVGIGIMKKPFSECCCLVKFLLQISYKTGENRKNESKPENIGY